MSPRITVLLPCYNSGATLEAAVDSVLSQTFTDFELLILDDGSKEEIRPFADPRITVLRSNENLGLSHQLNIGLDASRGEYVARLDADDLANPNRFVEQIEFLDLHPEIGICGSQAQLFDENGDRGTWSYPTTPEAAHATLFLRSSFLHPGVMIRRSVLDSNRLRYRPDLRVAQDYDLWTRLLKVTKGANLPSSLTNYRLSESQLTQAHSSTKIEETKLIRLQILEDLGLENTIEIYSRITSDQWEESNAFFDSASQWLNEVHQANAERAVFPHQALSKMLSEMYFSRCQCATRRGFKGLEHFQRLNFSDAYHPPSVDVWRSRAKSMLKPSLIS